MMNITSFFQDVLGANLKNQRWSWGAIDPITNRVFLRLWEDQIEQVDDVQRVHVYWKNLGVNSPGYTERYEHIEAIRKGALGIGVVCRAVDPMTTVSRRISNFQKDWVIELGEFTEDDRHIYARIKAKILTSKLARARTGHSTLAKDLAAILSERTLEATTREALVNARVGQGAFRSKVLSLWNMQCAVTESLTVDAIRASHIKPWRDSTNPERLDPYNGLPLVANLDALFDAGLISFDASGRMLVSSNLSQEERRILDVINKNLAKKPSKATVDYLDYHRTKIFQE